MKLKGGKMSQPEHMEKRKVAELADQRTHTMHTAERHALGEQAQLHAPREAHAEWSPPPDRIDPIGLLIDSSEGRSEELIEIRYGRMLASPFAFYRGSAAIMAYDLSHTPNSGINLQICGDCHLLNFGGFATPERNVIFDINDFDETSIGPWEWDLKRLAASFVIAGRSNDFAAEDSRKAAWLAVEFYRTNMARLGKKPVLDAWYEAMNLDELLDRSPDKKRARFYRKKLAKAAKKSAHEKAFAKLAHKAGSPAKIVDHPPLIFHHTDSHDHTFREAVEIGFAHYKESLSPELGLLLDRYKIEDVALKVVGVGSVGTVCGILLLMSAGEPLFLQFKEAGQSVVEPYAGASPYTHPGKRVVVGQRLMQSATDMFLGWTDDEVNHRPVYVRQLSDAKIKPVVSVMKPSNLFSYADICGQALATAHSRSGDAILLSGYMGESATFADAIADFAVAYAEQNERDYQAMVTADLSGRIQAHREE